MVKSELIRGLKSGVLVALIYIIERPVLAVIPSRSLNLLMKLLKPLCDKALRVFSSQQIYFAEINP